MKKTLLRVCLCIFALIGCVSVDKTRMQLTSKNSDEVRKAEENIYIIATKGRDSTGFISFETQQQIDYVNLTSNQDLLLRIVKDASKGEVIASAIGCIEFSKKGMAYHFIRQKELFGQLERMEVNQREVLTERIISHLTENELVDLISDRKIFCRDMLQNRLISITESPELLWRMRKGGIYSDDIEKRLFSLLDKVTDEELIMEMLNASGVFRLINSPSQRILLLKKLPETKMVEMVLERVKNHSTSEWNSHDLTALNLGVDSSNCVRESCDKMKILSSILDKLVEHYKKCERGWGWDKGDDEKTMKLLSGMSMLSSQEIIELVCHDDFTWKFLIEKVSADCAYDILVKGKLKSSDLEMELIKKLPSQKVDMKVLSGVKSDAGKKAVMLAMPADVKKSAQEFAKKAAVAIIEKSKGFAKETFELEGFYLGMSFEDMKTVFTYHFPDWEIKETIDGEGDEADHVIYIPGQRSPFCYASVKDKKVYQFNFGKKVLKKWYKYDVQNEREWARAYSRQHGIDMKYVNLMKETTVSIPQADLSYREYKAWLHQDTWQWKNNVKEYRLTYFAEPNIESAWNDVIKQEAFYRLRYVRGDAGSLRVKIERD